MAEDKSLNQMTRAELDERAKQFGIENPEHFSNMDEVRAAIQAKMLDGDQISVQDQNANDAATNNQDPSVATVAGGETGENPTGFQFNAASSPATTSSDEQVGTRQAEAMLQEDSERRLDIVDAPRYLVGGKLVDAFGVEVAE